MHGVGKRVRGRLVSCYKVWLVVLGSLVYMYLHGVSHNSVRKYINMMSP